MQYRIKELVINGQSFFYPEYKKRWFWRRFVWYGGEDGYTPYGVFYKSKSLALAYIEEDKEKRNFKPKPRKVIYHTV